MLKAHSTLLLPVWFITFERYPHITTLMYGQQYIDPGFLYDWHKWIAWLYVSICVIEQTSLALKGYGINWPCRKGTSLYGHVFGKLFAKPKFIIEIPVRCCHCPKTETFTRLRWTVYAKYDGITRRLKSYWTTKYHQRKFISMKGNMIDSNQLQTVIPH